jgi:hypothetical protein
VTIVITTAIAAAVLIGVAMVVTVAYHLITPVLGTGFPVSSSP